MKMPNDVYYTVREQVSNWKGTQEALQKLYDDIYCKYDDGREILERLESMYQRRFSGMNTH